MSAPEDVLANIPVSGLKILYAQDNPIESTKNKKGKELKKAILTYIEEAGVKALLNLLKRDQLQDLLASTGSDLESSSKMVLKKRLGEVIQEEGFSSFIGNAGHDLQRNTADALELDVKKKSQLEGAIEEEVQFIGLETYMESFDVAILKDVCYTMGLDAEHTSSKGTIIEAIINNESPARPKKTRPKAISYSKTKKPIKKGIRYQDIFQHYSVTELQEYARENDIIASGKKRVLINRILAFLDGDKSTLSKGRRGAKKGRSKKGGRK